MNLIITNPCKSKLKLKISVDLDLQDVLSRHLFVVADPRVEEGEQSESVHTFERFFEVPEADVEQAGLGADDPSAERPQDVL